MIHPPRHIPHVPAWVSQRAVLLAVLLGLVVGVVGPRLVPDRFSVSGPPALSAAEVTATVRSYLTEWDPVADPLVTLADGRQVKSSNVHGIDVAGTRYYYRLVHGLSADPVSRGALQDYEVVWVLDPGTEWETEVYRAKR